MKRKVLAVLFSVCLIASVAFAAGQSGKSAATAGSAQAQMIIKAKDLDGKKVLDSSGNDIGKIKSIALDSSTGTAYALIEVDNKLHPVPVSAIKKMGDDFSLSIDKNRLAQSPSFSEDAMEQSMSQRNFSTEVHRFFGIAPPTGAGSRMMQ